MNKENIDLKSLLNDCIFEVVLETGYAPVINKPKYKDIITLIAVVNCDKNSIKYHVENQYSGQVQKFDDYRKALGEFKRKLL